MVMLQVTVTAQNSPLLGTWIWIDGPDNNFVKYNYINNSTCTIYLKTDTITVSYILDTIAVPHRNTWYYNGLKANLAIWSISGNTLTEKASGGDTITFPASFGVEANYDWIASHYTKQLTTGINESRNVLFNLYPNPASDIVTLNINNSNIADFEIKIYNIMGYLVRSESLKQNQQKINVGDLNNGIYMIEIKSKEWSEKQKLIIQR
jgi:hypothetical protein